MEVSSLIWKWASAKYPTSNDMVENVDIVTLVVWWCESAEYNISVRYDVLVWTLAIEVIISCGFYVTNI